ncbi:dihydrolipoyl dehydrogenase [Phaeobacter gallaeciensis]|uniref:dihydrolipoyl dehydrogenase n=1 Tax=Phaeobacter gallaeciensis TaxID=60890 RepID=UPI002380732F|nr:dihydrolipoyl dehydrogenase [Phaeobacter gallaeciensis]MDE4275909.1 dihydrolipoyl dehydrogenase [Phaeobacter gallaeciensis]MDE4301137.1 dihydrolipoyl dehydrogenase [Phaeobacter gallaeciensis]MDE5187169.1 dihydrolipoyl dehydrogenase [Phaeobacter gallaeciensis]
MSDNHADLIVLGAGPGGYACAFRAADLGRKVVLVDPRATLGGVCLNEGCIPSKALLHAAEVIREARHGSDWGISTGKVSVDLDKLRDKKDGIVATLTGGLTGLAKRRKVQTLRGTATFTGANSLDIDGAAWSFDQAVIAVGSTPVQLPGWPNDDRIWDSTAALELREVPKALAIVGGGIIGLEMATVYAALGAKVSVIEFMDQIAPGADAEAVGILHAALQVEGVTIHTGTKVTKVKATKTVLSLTCEGGFDGTLKADAIIQAVGRRANGVLVAPEAAGIAIDERGVIAVDRACRTSVEGIFAIGDVTGNPMLAHRATHQGHVAAEVASGHAAALDTDLIPSVAYTSPELAWAGLTQAQAKERGIAHRVASFPWAASGRNLSSGGGDGLTKLVYCPETHRLLGATIVGRYAGELLAECVLAMEMGATLEDIALTVHAHPTLSETVAFTAERALGTLTDL